MKRNSRNPTETPNRKDNKTPYAVSSSFQQRTELKKEKIRAINVNLREESITADGRRIPCTILELSSSMVFTVFGGHVKKGFDNDITYLLQKSSLANYEVIFDVPKYELFSSSSNAIFSDELPPWFHIFSVFAGESIWEMKKKLNSDLIGIPSKTIFQGQLDNPELGTLISCVRFIRDEKTHNENYIFRDYFRYQLLNFTINSIKSNSKENLNLLIKVMHYTQNAHPTPRAEIYFNSVEKLANYLGRIPKTKEIFDQVFLHFPDGLEESVFYRDLKLFGLGWLIKKQSRVLPDQKKKK